MSFPHLTPTETGIDGIIDISSPQTAASALIVLTESTIQLLDQHYNAPLSKHTRSAEALEKYGKNLRVKRNKQDSLAVVQTSLGFLLVYSIVSSSDETLAVYNNANSLLQNGLVLQRQLGFFETNTVDVPILKQTLRFKLFLKVSHEITDYVLLDGLTMVLATSENCQLLDLASESPKILDIQGSVDKLIRQGNNVLALKSDGSAQLLKAPSFTPMDVYKVKGVVDCAVNEKLSLAGLLTEDSLVYYNYESHETVKVLPMKQVSSMQWSQSGNFLAVLYADKRWAFLSTFGCTIFHSGEHDYDSPWLSSVTSLALTDTTIYLSDGSTLFTQQLLRSLALEKQTNHDLKRQVLVCGPEVHIYTGHEMAISSSRAINWNVLKIPYEHYHQFPNITYASVSQDARYVALANTRSLLIYSMGEREWSFYQNEYTHDLQLGQITWFNKLNLLLVTNKTPTHSELVIFDLRKFDSHEHFNSSSVVFKYDLDGEIKLLNILGSDIVMYTSEKKYYHFHIEIRLTGLKIDLVKVLNMDKVFKSDDNFRALVKVKVDKENQDLLVLNNGELILLQEVNSKYQKFLLFDKIEYVYRINDEELYMFNGEDLLLVKDLTRLIQSRDPRSTVLKVHPDGYPLLLIPEKGLFVTMENSLLKRKTMEINSLTSKNSIYLHELIRFELSSKPVSEIRHRYQGYKNYPFALELLLYQTVTTDGDLTKVIELIELDPVYVLNVVSKCLRKIENKFWGKLLGALGVTPDELLQRAIELGEWRTLGILVIIFLNYGGEKGMLSLAQDQLIQILKLLYDNAHDDDELWENAFEMLRFLNLLDPTGELLKRAKQILSN